MSIDIGLDFGTTNCAIGRVRADGRPTTLGPLPSVAAFRNDEIFFGEQARLLINSADSTVHAIRDIKLLLGSGAARAGFRTLDATVLAAKLMAWVVKKLVGDEAVGTAVIGTPVHVNREHRVALREAAMKAGLPNPRLVYEPTAALIGAYEADHFEARDLVLVVDWGGGTLDIAVVQHQAGRYQELVVDGDRDELGGSRIDYALTTRILQGNPTAARRINEIEGGFERLKQYVEEAKIEILESLEGEEGETQPIVPEWLDEVLGLDPKTVYAVIRDFAARARRRISDILAQTGFSTTDITHLLFAGGTCKCTAICDEIAKEFPGALRINNPDPQLGTGRGCTRLSGSDFAIELAGDVAVRQCDDTVCVMLRRGQIVELNTYVTADFRVTDVYAQQALFDIGLCNFSDRSRNFIFADGNSFRSLRSFPLALGGRAQGDLVRLHLGLDDNLMVAAYAQSNKTKACAQEFIPGIPLAVRIRGRRP